MEVCVNGPVDNPAVIAVDDANAVVVVAVPPWTRQTFL